MDFYIVNIFQLIAIIILFDAQNVQFLGGRGAVSVTFWQTPLNFDGFLAF